MIRILAAFSLSLIVFAATTTAEAKGKKANNSYPKDGIVFTCFDGDTKCGNWTQPAPAGS